MFVVAFLTFMANGGFPSVFEDMKVSLLLLQCDYWVYNMKDGKEIWSLTLAINSLNFGNYINFLENFSRLAFCKCICRDDIYERT